jgi:hypothetical protein
MRRERVKYPRAYHHVMDRGYDGNDIFTGNKNKNQFLDYLEDYAKKMRSLRTFMVSSLKTSILPRGQGNV